MRAALKLLSLLLFVVACRPKQAEIDEINHKLDELAIQQQVLIENIGNQWAAERQGSSAQAQAQGTRASEYATLVRIEEQILSLQVDVEALSDDVSDLKARPSPPTKAKGPRPGRPDPKKRYRVDVGTSHVRGRSDALITVVMWTDYQCPFCKRVQPTVEQVRQHYGKKLRVVMKHNPLPMHNRAMPAALAAEAAGRQGKFWEMHEKLYQDPRALTDENIERYATELGLSMKKFRRDLQDSKLADRIKAEQAQGSKLGARGTPAFFINGRFLSGAQPFDAFEALIDEELEVAQKLVKKGTKKRSVYKTLMKDAREKP